MPLRFNTYPHCCTADVLFNFEGAGEDENLNRTSPVVGNGDVTVENIRNFLRNRWGWGHALVTAVTNSRQVAAEKVLTEVGFIPTAAMKKTQHPETTIKHWTFQLDTLGAR